MNENLTFDETNEQFRRDARGSHKSPCVYRLFDKDGVLLYIGMSMSAFSRMAQHVEFSWYREVVTVTIEHKDSRAEAWRSERNAIITERPKYNIEHTDRISASRDRSAGKALKSIEEVEAAKKRVNDALKRAKYKKQNLERLANFLKNEKKESV